MISNMGIPVADKNQNLYLHAIPLSKRQLLCAILDNNKKWINLAKCMGYNNTFITEIKQSTTLGNSPTDKLITLWAEYNHNVTELFILLKNIEQYEAMNVIKDLVNPKYHRLILQISQFQEIEPTNNNTERNHVNRQNRMRDDESKILNASRENNESIIASSIVYENAADELASKIPEIDYLELVQATDNWNKRNLLGSGGFGTVYKGTWKMTDVAIKRLENRSNDNSDSIKVQIQQSLNELKYLNSVRHDNILSLYGYSKHSETPCLVYQLMQGGSLEQRLKNHESPLSWKKRLTISQGIARGLQFLHTFKEKPLIHGDIKPANILLDLNDHPKIGDFGLAREGPNTLKSSVEISRVYGTRPYLPVDFLCTRKLSANVDTFSFGVVLYELATEYSVYISKTTSERPCKFLWEYMSFLLGQKSERINYAIPFLSNELGKQVAQMFIELGRKCTNEKPQMRPEMSDVLKILLQYG